MRRVSAAAAAACLASCLGAAAWSQQVVLGLEQAFHLAESHSAELMRLRAQRIVDREGLRLAYRDFLPHLGLAYARNDAVVYAAPDSRSRRLSLDLQMLVYGGGTRAAERDRQRAALRLDEEAVGVARQELQLQVARRFIQVLSLHLQQELLGESQRSAAQQIAIALEEWRLGEITELDYLDMAVAATDLEVQRAALQIEETRLLFELKQMVGLPPTLPVVIAGRINIDFPGLLDSSEPRFYLAAAQQASLELHRRRTELSALSDAARRARFGWMPSLTAQAQLAASGAQFPLSEPGISVGLSLDFQTPLLPGAFGATAGRYGSSHHSASTAASVAVGDNLRALQAARLARLELQTAAALFQDFQAGLESGIRRQLQQREQQLHALGLQRERVRLRGKRQELMALMLELGEVTRAHFVEEEIELAGLRVRLVDAVAALFELEAALLQRCGLPISAEAFQRIILQRETAP